MKRLTDDQKNAIQNFRAAGLGYKAIAEKMSISRETVRSFCIRNNVSKFVDKTEDKSTVATTDAKNEFCFGGTVFIISTDYSKKATETLEDKLKSLIFSSALNQSENYQFIQN